MNTSKCSWCGDIFTPKHPKHHQCYPCNQKWVDRNTKHCIVCERSFILNKKSKLIDRCRFCVEKGLFIDYCEECDIKIVVVGKCQGREYCLSCKTVFITFQGNTAEEDGVTFNIKLESIPLAAVIRQCRYIATHTKYSTIELFESLYKVNTALPGSLNTIPVVICKVIDIPFNAEIANFVSFKRPPITKRSHFTKAPLLYSIQLKTLFACIKRYGIVMPKDLRKMLTHIFLGFHDIKLS